MLHGPIVVGGIGGSGTRVVAHILQVLGGYMGSNLNETLDNLWFTLLMKRPEFRARCRAGEDSSTSPLAVFEKAMTAGLEGSPFAHETHIVEDAFREHLGDVTLSQVLSLLHSTEPDESEYRFWGFKEPCSAMWVEELASFFPRMSYVHVVRDGADMCLSHTMRNMMRHWGSQYGIDAEAADPTSAITGKKAGGLHSFWAKANAEAISAAWRTLGSSSLVVVFEDLCVDPEKHVEMLADLAGVDATPGMIMEAACSVRVPSSIGRGAHLESAEWA